MSVAGIRKYSNVLLPLKPVTSGKGMGEIVRSFEFKSMLTKILLIRKKRRNIESFEIDYMCFLFYIEFTLI